MAGIRSSSLHAEVVTGRRGMETALVTGESGASVYLHSLYDPAGEAKAYLPGKVGANTLVFLGAGLGYHIPAALAANPQVSRIIIVEIYPALAEIAARRVTAPGLRVDLVTQADPAALGEAPMIPGDISARDIHVIAHTPSLNANPSWYARCQTALATAGLSARDSQPEEKKWAGALTILFLYGAYYGQNECIKGFEDLGHRVVLHDYRENEAEYTETFRRKLLDERPDAVFSVNLRGMDRRGVMGEILAGMGIPLIVWFVDSPEFILYGEALPPVSATRIFMWEKSYLPMVRELGYDVDYLPLAADETLLNFAKVSGRFAAPLAFVGNSLMGGFLNRLAVKHPLNEEMSNLAKSGMAQLQSCRGRQLEALKSLIDRNATRQLEGEALLFFRAYLLHSATTMYRTSLLERLLPHQLTFFGDPDGWRQVFGPGIDARPDVNYYRETPSVYASSTVNFNATSFQMPRAVNQRVFDVPLCGGFLLTDRQEDLLELFADDEVALYEGPEDVAEKAAHYLANPLQRREIAEKAHARVRNEHTYRRRMKSMLDLVFGE